MIAFLVRLGMVLHGAGLDGNYGYDNGVYFAAATALVHGRMPYADFVLLHPPGVVLALAPFAALGSLTHDSVGFEAARVGWMLLGAVNSMLVVRAARQWGTTAAVAGGLFYALWTPAALTEIETRLEPLVTLGLLLALGVLLRPRATITSRGLVLAGVALGFAVGVKIWAAAPLVVLLLWCVWRLGWRSGLRLAAGAAAGAAAVCLPFAVNAPSAMVRMVVGDQLGRGRESFGTGHRLRSMLAVLPVQPTDKPTLLTGLLGIAVVVLVLLSVLSRRRGIGLVVTLLGVQVAVLLMAPSYFTFYAAFLAPALALAVGCGVGALVRGARRVRLRSVLTPAALAALAAVAVGLGFVVWATRPGLAVPASRMQALVAGARCVTGDAPEGLLLADALDRDLANGCPVMVDVTGLTHDRDRSATLPAGRPTPLGADAAWQRDLGDYLLSGQRIVLARSLESGVGPALRHRLAERPVLLSSAEFVVLGPPRRGA
ncbi:MAG: glycosyltransferase 87 family protein [Amnibacterium sp.]